MHYRLIARTQRSRASVELQPVQKDRIRTLVAHLKLAVDRAEMPDWRKDRLRKSIGDFEKALDGKRLSLASAMVFVGLVGAGLHSLGQGAEGVGKLVHEITVAIGQSKEIEDTTRPALPEPATTQPVYLIESDQTPPSLSIDRSEFDDEIPF